MTMSALMAASGSFRTQSALGGNSFWGLSLITLAFSVFQAIVSAFSQLDVSSDLLTTVLHFGWYHHLLSRGVLPQPQDAQPAVAAACAFGRDHPAFARRRIVRFLYDRNLG